MIAGTRITHYTSVATVASGSYELIEDPSGPLHDPVTGKRYRESFTSTAPPAGGTGSGDGFFETTVAAVDGGLTVTVSQVCQGPNGPAVVIGLSMPGVQSETHYDVGTGVMLAQAVSIRNSGITTRIQLQQMP